MSNSSIKVVSAHISWTYNGNDEPVRADVKVVSGYRGVDTNYASVYIEGGKIVYVDCDRSTLDSYVAQLVENELVGM